MEKPSFDALAYRDGVAQDLKELRKIDKGIALEYHGALTQTSRYVLAKEEHQELVRGKVAQGKPTHQEKEVSLDRGEIMRRAAEIVRQNPGIFFFASGVGNVLNKKGGHTDGVKLYVFDHATQTMVEGAGIRGKIWDQARTDDETLYRPFAFKHECEDMVITSFHQIPSKHEFGDMIIYSVRLPFRGYSGNKFAEDTRRGVHLTVGVGIPKDSKPEDLFGLEASEVFKNESAYCELAMEYCTKEFIPDYYNFVESLAEKAKK